MKNITLHQSAYFCRPSKISSYTDIIEGTNESLLNASSIECDEEPPEIPSDLFFIDNRQKLTKISNKIAREAYSYMQEHKEQEMNVLKAISKAKIDAFNDEGIYFQDIDSNETMLSIIRRRCKNVSLPTKTKAANNVIYSVFVLSPKSSDQLTIKQKLHQWILVLGSNTLKDLVDSIKCPLCELAQVLSNERQAPRKLKKDDDFIYDFAGGFDAEIGNVVTKLNDPLLYISNGCTHTILFTTAVTACVDEEAGFPKTIGGRGATPPLCCICTVNPGTVAVRKSQESPVEFACINCSAKLEKENVIKDLTHSFFHADG